MTSRGAALAGLLVLASAACGGNRGRDVVDESRDVVASGDAPSQGERGYEYVAHRLLGVVALAEARGLDPALARAAIDHLADRLDACVTEERRKGNAAEGAARVVVHIDASGNVAPTTVRVDPGAGSASSAVLCLVAPLKVLTFPPADTDARGMAIEALWGRVQAAP